MEFKAGGLKIFDVRFKFALFSVLGIKNYMMIVLMNGR